MRKPPVTERGKAIQRAIRKKRNQQLRSQTKAVPTAILSPVTRERLLAEACHSLSCAGMSRENVRVWLDERMAAYLKDQPWWFGQMRSADSKAAKNLRRHQINNGQIEANEQPLNLRRIPDVQYEPIAARGTAE